MENPQNTVALDAASIRAAITALLPEPLDFDDDANLIECGLDSLRVMRLLSQWRKAGAKVTFAELFEHPTLRGWLSLLAPGENLPETSSGTADLTGPFPLTDLQYAYWIGRRDDQPLGGVGCHAYIEFDGTNVEPDRLAKAWRLLLQRHPMLRARFREDGQQEILPEAQTADLVVHDLRAEGAVQKRLDEIRESLSHRRLEVEKGQVIGLALSLLPEGKTRLHFDVDLLVADAQSLKILLRDLAEAYERGAISRAPEGWSFAAYLARRAANYAHQEAEDSAYWKERLASLPGAPALPLRRKPEEMRCPRFHRRTRLLTAEQWQRFQARAASFGVTPALGLLTAYAEVLARWSETPRFLINMPLYDRQEDAADGADLENAVADFTNVLLLEADCSAEAGFLERLRGLQARLYKDMAHTGYSGVRVLRELSRLRPGENLSAPVVFAGNVGTRLLEAGGSPFGRPAYMISQTPQVWLDFQLYDTEEGLLLSWDAVEDLFREGVLDQMFAGLNRLLDWLCAEDSDWAQSFDPALPPQKRQGEEGEPVSGLLHESFFAYAAAHPDSIALIPVAGESLSYGCLAKESLRIASLLRASGVEPGELVAVTLPRGPGQIAAVLGVLAAACAYAPISPEQPPARRERLHRRAGIRFVLTDANLKASLAWPEGCTVLDLALAPAEALDAPCPASPEELAYVIFTSGSTGEPKGVEISHAAAWNTIAALVRRYGLGPEDRGLAVSALDFDLSVFDVFGLLGVGASLVVLDEASRRNAEVWRELVAQHRVSLWNSVPILLDMLLASTETSPGALSSLRLALLSGDWISLSLPARLAAAASECRFVALGGATEAAIWSNVQDVSLPLPENWQSIPYGRALPGQAYRVLDARLRDCPDWVAGELWIGGAGVARGYRGAPALTDQSFVLHEGQRWYRTGDLGRFWPDGTLEFLGRRDFQVKIRGHRIELGEIEAAIAAFPEAREAAVTVFDSGRGVRRLRAFVSPVSDSRLDPEALRAFLEERLPEYMLPSVFTVLEALPLSANGKLDRKALAALPLPEEEGTGTLPSSPLEKELALIWQKLLSVSVVRLNDSFFELGGDSLLATRLAGLVREAFGVALPLHVLFAQPTFSEVAAFLETALLNNREAPAEELPQLVPQPESRLEAFPLTEIQHAYWIGRINAYELGNVASHIFFEFDEVRLDLERLREAWARLVERHDMLRAVFLPDGTQRILEQNVSSGFVLTDLRGMDATATEQALEAIRAEMSTQTLPAESGPLFDLRALLYDSAEGEKVRLFLDFDALIADAWSLFLLLEEWQALYQDRTAELPPLNIGFRDYVLADRALRASEACRADWAYWNARLDSIPMPPDLPLAKNPSALNSSRTKRRSIVLPKSRWEALKTRIRQADLSPSGFLVAVYAEALGRWTRSPRFTLNLTLFNRLPLHPQVEDLVGDFTSLDLLVVEGGSGTFLDNARRLQRQLWEDLNHRLVDGVQVLRELGKRGRRPAPAVVFTGAVGLGSARDASALSGLGSLVASITQTPQVCLDHQAYEQNGDLVLNWDAVEELFPEGMMDALFGAYCGLLEGLAEGRGWDAPALPELPEDQRARRAAYNATDAPVARATLDELFRAQVQACPENLAVITPESRHTYAELAARADAVASALHERGADRQRLVAVVLEKGWDQITAVTGVIRAGAAYLPIDPTVPAERLHLLLRAGEVEVALTSATLRDTLRWPVGVLPLAVEQLPESGTVPPPETKPEDLAYVIYTSGSTGQPKGVVIDHQGVVNTVLDINERFGVTAADRLFGISGLHFDLSAYDIWGALSCGAALVLPAADRLRDPSHWLPLMREHGVSLWNSVPALMQMLTEYALAHSSLPPSLRLVLLSGDWIPLGLPEAIRQQVPKAQIISLGGATEASIWSIHYPIKQVDPAWQSIPYGMPLRNQRFHVLDKDLRECPEWVTGDLYIGGLGLAQGYWKDQERTEAAFVVHPKTGDRLYRTGDTGRFLPEGCIEFLGREDFQVKVHGHRIELGEIEAALRAHELVDEAIVLVTGASEAEKRLVAFVLAQGDPDSNALVDFVAQKLPRYMVPSWVSVLDRLPLSANGKVDRKELARMAQESGREARQALPPATDAEKRTAQVWTEVLGRREIGAEDNFFDLGGTSVLAVRLHQKLVLAFGRPFPMVSVFEYPTVRAFAGFAANEGKHQEAKGANSDRIARRRARLGRRGTPGK